VVVVAEDKAIKMIQIEKTKALANLLVVVVGVVVVVVVVGRVVVVVVARKIEQSTKIQPPINRQISLGVVVVVGGT
jgi:heme/copper-type cytochrome/quinol oxidase subunit 2